MLRLNILKMILPQKSILILNIRSIPKCCCAQILLFVILVLERSCCLSYLSP